MTLPPRAEHCGLMGQPRAGRGLVEGHRQDLVLQQVGVLTIVGDRGQLLGHFENVIQLGPVEVLEGEDVPSQKSCALKKPPPESGGRTIQTLEWAWKRDNSPARMIHALRNPS